MSAEGVVVGRGRQGGMCGEVGVRSGGGCSRLLQRDEFHHDDTPQRDEDRAGPRVLLREERRPLVLVHQPGDEVEVVHHVEAEDGAADRDGLRRGEKYAVSRGGGGGAPWVRGIKLAFGENCEAP